MAVLEGMAGCCCTRPVPVKAMQDMHSAVDESNGTDRRIDSDRITRAMTENLSVAVIAPAQYAVTHDDRRYDVDVGAATCECGDATYRDVVCKHQVAAAVFHAYLSEPNTRFVARVLRAVGEHGCAHDVRGCAGPVALGDRGIPCQSCIESVTPGVWTVWNRLVASRVVAPDDLPTAETALVADLHERDVESAVATDGGACGGPPMSADGRLVATDGGKDEDAFACPWTNCHETFPRAGGDHPDALLLTSHAYAIHNGHLGNPESCVIEGSQ